MKKVIIGLLLVSNSAYADVTAHVQFIGSILLGGAIATALQNYEKPKTPETVQVISANSPAPLGKKCELKSVTVNGQVVTNNYCY